MNRTFHQQFSLQAFAAILIVAVMGLWCFLSRTGPTPIIGLCCMLTGAAAVDRLVNTTYTFTTDGNLVISRGRLGKRLVIAVDEIVAARPIRGSLFVARHIIIEYGAGHTTFAQPSDTDAFLKEIKRRHNQELCTEE